MASMLGAARIGVFGGTFDPIHIGHLIIATELAEALELDRVLFVPAGQPPHKSDLRLSPDADRLAMVNLAIAGNPAFASSTIELDRPGPSYTAALLETLTEELPNAQLVFLMGEDSLRDLPTWRDPADIVRLAELGVAMRPSTEADLETIYRSLPEARGRIHVVPTTQIGISSSGLRDQIQSGRSVRYQVPEQVWRYIADRGLYRAR
jgi:nicotinate-nucleotide adenylyltransferase